MRHPSLFGLGIDAERLFLDVRNQSARRKFSTIGENPMAESKQERAERAQAEKQFRVRFLVRETGITEAQARALSR